MFDLFCYFHERLQKLCKWICVALWESFFKLSLRKAMLLEEKVRLRMSSICDSHLPASGESHMRSPAESSPRIAYGSRSKCHLHLIPHLRPSTWLALKRQSYCIRLGLWVFFSVASMCLYVLDNLKVVYVRMQKYQYFGAKLL